jgi:hypothetical protein
MMFAKFTLNLLQRFLVSRMNRLIGQEGDKGYFLGRRSHLQSEQFPFLMLHLEEDKIALRPGTEMSRTFD